MTIRFAVVGSPISHSLSPTLHKAAYEHLGLGYGYEVHEVRAGDLARFWHENNFAGLSVTMPLKTEAFLLGEVVGEEAKVTKGANTVIGLVEGVRIENTDVFGIEMALQSIISCNQITVLGAGATAKSALVALSRIFPDAELSLVSRNISAGKELLDFAQLLGMKATALNPDAELLASSDLVMSLVPAGSYLDLWQQLSSISPKGTLFDAAYSPWPSIPAQSWSGQVVSGIEMLKWQAILQVEYFCEAAGADVVIDRASLFQVMSEAVSDK
jgi:shikimate dehydrogenase